jgi:hypothetical protein
MTERSNLTYHKLMIRRRRQSLYDRFSDKQEHGLFNALEVLGSEVDETEPRIASPAA